MDFLYSPSTVDWCEKNYTYLSWIAELWNTLSSLVLFYAGYIGYIRHRNLQGSSVYLILAIVGAGSVFFHGALTAATQMLDEIPMIFLVLQLSLNIVNVTSRAVTIISYLVAFAFSGVICYTAFLEDVPVNALEDKSLQHNHEIGSKRIEFYIFQSAIILMGFCIFHQLLLKATRKTHTKHMFIRGCLLFLIGWCCWLIDYFCCAFLHTHGNPQLHAWWHLFSALGVYHLSLLSLVFSNPQYDLRIETHDKDLWGIRIPLLFCTLDTTDKSY